MVFVLLLLLLLLLLCIYYLLVLVGMGYGLYGIHLVSYMSMFFSFGDPYDREML